MQTVFYQNACHISSENLVHKSFSRIFLKIFEHKKVLRKI
jgi:hypothetical protein